MFDLILSRRMNVIKFSQVISRVNVESNANVSKSSSVSIFREIARENFITYSSTKRICIAAGNNAFKSCQSEWSHNPQIATHSSLQIYHNGSVTSSMTYFSHNYLCLGIDIVLDTNQCALIGLRFTS
jgi:hypothetical protein